MTSAPMLLYYRYPADLAVPYQRYSSAAYPSVNLDDSDNEPLLPHSHRLSALSTSPYTPRTYSQHMYAAPSFLSTPIREDSIIPAILVDVIPAERRYSSRSDSSHDHDTIRQNSKTGLVSRLVKKRKNKAKNAAEEKEKRYLKHFARGQSGEYVGTEPHRRWTEEELEQTFGKFRPPVKRNSGMFWGRG
ncbi:hypothetical protein SBOR_1013 [Sclerotinia borealis F-4128]|uniref:Uncharacterized protein n=1 Tax=Sclerotinia borealis (strain F-4128) TaxID=1432307 RepID=W9CR46_SCLBF|nr:hypothetical protein SBOR_1013 [Sclerotinia borealis F-4128]